MKQLIYFILPITLLFACNSNENNDNESASASSSEVITEFIELTFEGSLKAKKDIPVAMKLNKAGRKVSGQMLYKKIGQPLNVTGTIDDAGTIKMQESIDDEITGSYEGQIVDNIFTGIWKSANKKTSFDFSLNISDNDFSTFVKEKEIDILKHTGFYEIKPSANQDADYHYTFEIERTSEDNIRFLFNGNRGKPSYNMGSLEGEAIFKDGTATFYSNNLETCGFQLVFSNDGLTASYLDNKDNCEFGFGVYLEGDYIKTNSDKPTFESPMK